MNNKPEDVPHAGVKFDAGKPQLDLLPPHAIDAMGRVLSYGAAKYARFNFLLGMDHGRMSGAALRHIFAYLRGEDIDPESGLPHLSHAIASLAMLIESQARGVGKDDRFDNPAQKLIQQLECKKCRKIISETRARVSKQCTDCAGAM